MKLMALSPRWIGYSEQLVNGISFLCPHCMTQRLAIHFDPPIDPDNWWPRLVQPTYAGMNIWRRLKGETFEDLTIEPSVNAEIEGHWHGFIKDGEVS